MMDFPFAKAMITWFTVAICSVLPSIDCLDLQGYSSQSSASAAKVGQISQESNCVSFSQASCERRLESIEAVAFSLCFANLAFVYVPLPQQKSYASSDSLMDWACGPTDFFTLRLQV